MKTPFLINKKLQLTLFTGKDYLLLFKFMSGDGHFAPPHSKLLTCVQVSGNEFLSQKILDGSS